MEEQKEPKSCIRDGEIRTRKRENLFGIPTMGGEKEFTKWWYEPSNSRQHGKTVSGGGARGGKGSTLEIRDDVGGAVKPKNTEKMVHVKRKQGTTRGMQKKVMGTYDLNRRVVDVGRRRKKQTKWGKRED